eukprot:TRINITY_DN8165_c0_g1_i2.p1 TRINITY_DN8165_c0_g1~~TRINITY_DN8165_c0_g1_i2.p1  ORF type:complete len:1119 (+),score=317.47 TRINITY_DN8165_c0_g1_i2:43-3399(+)
MADETPDIEVRVKVLTGQELLLEVNPDDTVLDLRQMLGEAVETCYITSYDIIDKNGEVLQDYDTLGDVQKGDVYKMRFKKYRDKDFRYHVSHVQELLMVKLDEVMISMLPVVQGEEQVDQQTARSYPSLTKMLSGDGKSSGNRDHTAALSDFNMADQKPDPTTVGDPKKIELPDPGPYACAEDFTTDVTLDGFFDLMKQIPAVKYATATGITITWSGFNPPQRHRKLQGDLGYVDIQFTGGTLYQVTCTPNGFYVNQSKAKSELNPSPAAKPCNSETLLGLIFQLSPKHKEKACELLKVRASLHPFETGPMVLPQRTEWVDVGEGKMQSAAGIRYGEGCPAVLDHHIPVRTWNDEVQRALELPSGTFAERFFRDKALSRLHTEFIDFASQAVVTAVDGRVTPLNPQEPQEAWVYLINNTFISQAADTRKTYQDIGGDRAACVFAKQDLHGLQAIRKLRTTLSTVSTAIFDYKGKRMLCQTLVPGILMRKADGKIAAPQVLGVGEENEKLYLTNEHVQEELKRLAPALHCEPHMMRDAEGNEHEVHINAELKAMHSSDDRHYLLECSKLTPRDVNWMDNPLAFVRFELVDDFVKSKRTHEVYQKIGEEIAKKREEGESSLDIHFWALEEIRKADEVHAPKFNCDLHTFSLSMEHIDPKEKTDASHKQLEELAAFLKSKLPTIVTELVNNEIVDTECLRDVFHDYGVNMRYLGEVIEMLPKWATHAVKLCTTELVSRVIKHKLRDVMQENSLQDLAAPIVQLLNSILGEKGKGGNGKAKKKNKKKKETKEVLGERWIEEEALKRFRHKLPEGWLGGLSKFMLLRAVCSKVGLSIKQKEYDFTEETPFEPDDIVDVTVVLHHHPPHYSIMEALLDNCQQEPPEVMAQKVRHALTHANVVIGAVSSESALCFQALAKMLMADIDTAIQYQYKALIISRRLYGATHGSMVSLLKNIAVMAYISGRYYPAIQYLRKALYLSRALSGDVNYDILFNLASFYNKMGYNDRAVNLLKYAVDKASLNPDDKERLAVCTQHLALVYGYSGDITKAIETQKAAFELFTDAIGPEDPQTKDADSWYRYWIKAAVDKAKMAKTAIENKAAANAKKKAGGAAAAAHHHPAPFS